MAEEPRRRAMRHERYRVLWEEGRRATQSAPYRRREEPHREMQRVRCLHQEVEARRETQRARYRRRRSRTGKCAQSGHRREVHMAMVHGAVYPLELHKGKRDVAQWVQLGMGKLGAAQQAQLGMERQAAGASLLRSLWPGQGMRHQMGNQRQEGSQQHQRTGSRLQM